MIVAGIGRFGPYVKLGPKYKSLDPDDDVLTIGLNRAVDLLANTSHRKGPTGKTLGNHPEDGKPILLFETGRYGPYVGHGKVYATLPRDQEPGETSLEQALALIAARVARGPGKKKFARGKTKASEPKPAKKTATKAPSATPAKRKTKPRAKVPVETAAE
jgi:DNA topoisomerase-1